MVSRRSSSVAQRPGSTVNSIPPASTVNSARPGLANVPDKSNVTRDITNTMGRMIDPQKKLGSTTYKGSLKAIAVASWLNVLLTLVPVGWALHFTIPDNHTIVFIINYISIIPLATLLGFGAEELALRVGQTIGGLLTATFGNAVELIVAIIALLKCQIRIAQSLLVGSILSNLLLVLGICFFAGGTRYSEQGFTAGAAQLNSSLLTISVIAILLPAAFHFAVNTDTDLDEGSDVLHMSHGVAIVLLLIYACYLFVQLWSQGHLHNVGEHGGEAMVSTAYPQTGKSLKGIAMSAIGKKQPTDAESNRPPARHEDTKEVEKAKLNVTSAVVLLLVATVLVTFTAEFLVDSIDGLASGGKISKEFIGLILLPIVGNAAEHITAVTVSVKDKLLKDKIVTDEFVKSRLDLSIGVAMGSSIQIALFVIPLLVVIAWGLNKPLTLLNDPLESVVLFLSVLVVNHVISDGKSNWLEGIILMMLYVIVAVSFWYYPGSNALEALGAAVNLTTCAGTRGE